MVRLLVVLFLLCCACEAFCQTRSADYLVAVKDSVSGTIGYRDQSGRLRIPFGKYTYTFTDTLYQFAIVAQPGQGFIGIDRSGKKLFRVFPFDNGPDDPAEGLFRIVEGDKIGYANVRGRIVIVPQFSGAFPFERGKAKVSKECTVRHNGEHSAWVSKSWFYINRSGKRVK